MADRYLTESDVYAHVEADVVRSILAPSGTSLAMLIERATALVQGSLRNSGYTVPSTQDPTTIADQSVVLATLCHVRNMLCSMPSTSLERPDSYKDKTHPEMIALLGILSGDLILNLPRSDIQSVGGWGFTSTTAHPERASRTSFCQLKGW